MFKSPFITIRFLLAAFLGLACASSSQASEAGRLTGGQAYQIPGWFHESFLDLPEDIEEARQGGKHLLLFLHLDHCPYCSKMLKTGFRDYQKEIAQHFVPVALNIKGGRGLKAPDGTEMSEKAYAVKLRVTFTPTLVFLDDTGKIVARLNGYQPPENLKKMLDYVRSKSYKTSSFPAFVQKQKTQKQVYHFVQDKLFQKKMDFSKVKTPLAILFEDSACKLCATFHKAHLRNAKNLKELEKFTVVRLDANSNETIITPQGYKITVNEWANQLKLAYRPGLILFNEGKEYGRLTSMLSNHHFRYLLKYTSEQQYQKYENWLHYLEAEEARRVKAGEVVNIME